MPASKKQETLTVQGTIFIWTRLPVTASVQLWAELAPVVLPAVMEVLINTPLVRVDGKWMMRDFDVREFTALPEALRKALKELPFARIMSIAKQALASVYVGNVRVADDFDKSLESETQFFELLVRALGLQYEGFIDVLGGLGVRLPGQAPSPSGDSSTSAGPSSAS